MSCKAIAWVAALALSAGMCASAEATLLLRYSFDEVSGVALDSGATPTANGTFGGTSTRVTSTPGGAPGYAMSTNGGAITSYVTGGDADKLDGLTKLTVCGWINLQANPGQFDRFVSDHSNVSTGWDVFVASGTASSFTVRLGVDNVDASVVSGNINANQTWAFIAVTYDGALTANNVLYYSGSVTTAVAQSGTTGTLNMGPTAANGTDFRVGGTPRSTFDRTPNAYFDDIRVYNEVLNSAQLDAVRLSSIPEPGALALCGIAGLAVLRRRRSA